MKREIIFTDVELQKRINESKLQKETALIELKDYLKDFVTINDVTNKEELFKAIEAKYNDFSKHISFDKKLELIDFSLSRYEFLVERYNAIDVIDAEVNIYAESKDELRRLKLSKDFIQTFCNLINEKNGRTIYVAPIVNALGGILSFNYATGQMEINQNFIKQP